MNEALNRIHSHWNREYQYVMDFLFDDTGAEDRERKGKGNKKEGKGRLEPESAERDDGFLSRHDDQGFMSIFVEQKVIHDYLKCDIPPWKYPTSSKDKVELEPLPTKFLPPISLKPILFPNGSENGKYKYIRRVCGYREIYKKRLYIEYLKEKEEADWVTVSIKNASGARVHNEIVASQKFRLVAPGGGRKSKEDRKNKPSKSKLRQKLRGSEDKHRDRDKEPRHKTPRVNERQDALDEQRSKLKPGRNQLDQGRLELGSTLKPEGGRYSGRRSKKDGDQPAKTAQVQALHYSKRQDDSINNNVAESSNLPISSDRAISKSDLSQSNKRLRKSKKTSIRIGKSFGTSGQPVYAVTDIKNKAGGTSSAAKKQVGGPTKTKDAKAVPSKSKPISSSKPKAPNTTTPSSKSKSSKPATSSGKEKDTNTSKTKADPNKSKTGHDTNDLATRATGKEELDRITDFDKYYKFVFGEDLVEPAERDSEWLQLSETDEESETDKIQSFGKELLPSMLEGISYESQILVSEMKLLHICSLLLARSFYYNEPKFKRGHIEFITKITRIIPFFMSSFILWASAVLIFQSFVELRSGDSSSAAVLIEQLEMSKYSVPILFVTANLFLVAIWSVLVILRDGQLITHYLNCWCSALKEMETSGALSIKIMTVYNLVIWLVSCTILVICFVVGTPANVRGTCGLVSMLIFRGMIPDIRLRLDAQFIGVQIFGLFFIMYVLFCARMLFTLMQIISIIIRNTAEMWNYKFAHSFKQLVCNNRGVLNRMSLNMPVTKFFGHHRIITSLLKIYGQVFAAPIAIYMVVHMAVITSTLVWLFNFKAGKASDHRGQENVIYDYSDKDANNTIQNITIPYFHTPVEEITTSLFVLVHTVIDFVFTTEIVSTAGESFFDGFEFVRRTNLILAANTHQRRVIQSLLWSFSSTDPSVLSANRFFPVGRPTVVAALGTSIFFFSLIIQLQSKKKQIFVNIERCVTVENGITKVSLEPRCAEITSNIKKNQTTVETAKIDFYIFFEHCFPDYGTGGGSNENDFASLRFVDFTFNKNGIGAILSKDKSNLPMCIINIKQDDFDVFTPAFYRYLNMQIAQEMVKQWERDQFRPATLNVFRGHERCSHEKIPEDHAGGSKPAGLDCRLSFTEPRNLACPLCTWIEFFRDCFTSCYSRIHEEYFVLPVILQRTSNGQYAEYFKYAKTNKSSKYLLDCGINPYAKNTSGSVPSLYDCFGTELDTEQRVLPPSQAAQPNNDNLRHPLKLDICGFYGFRYPVYGSFTSSSTNWGNLINSTNFLPDIKQQTESNLEESIIESIRNKTSPFDRIIANCYDDRYTASRKCSRSKYAQFCGLSSYPGVAKRGYWRGQYCQDLAWKYPTHSAFCESIVFGVTDPEEKNLAGSDNLPIYQNNSVDEKTYQNIKTTQWDKEFPQSNPSGYPCNDRVSYNRLGVAEKLLAFRFACPDFLDRNGSIVYREFLRPYYITKSGNLKQIPYNYDGKEPQKLDVRVEKLCEHLNEEKTPYPLLPYNFTDPVDNTEYEILDYIGCHGLPLMNTNNTSFSELYCIPDRLEYRNLTSNANGPLFYNCEINGTTCYFFPEDCADPLVQANNRVSEAENYLISYDWKYDLCRFKGLSLQSLPFRQISTAWYQKYRMEWDRWNKTSQTYAISKQSQDLTAPFCGEKSTLGWKLPLPLQNVVPKEVDLELCTWEPAYRDCYRPCRSEILNRWIWMPIWIDARTKKPFTNPILYQHDCAFESFNIEPEITAIRCDEGSIERQINVIGHNNTNTFPLDQRDDCGWVFIPEFNASQVRAYVRNKIPVDRIWHTDDGTQITRPPLQCYNTPIAQDRCRHPEIHPYCGLLKYWIQSHGKFVRAYRFGEIEELSHGGCVFASNKEPEEDGFCEVLFPERLIYTSTYHDYILPDREYDVDRSLTIWNRQYNMSGNGACGAFPGLLKSNVIRRHRFLEYHCMDPRTATQPFRRKRKSLYYPMYKTSEINLVNRSDPILRFVPWEYLKQSFEACQDDNEYPLPLVILKADGSVDANLTELNDYLGCHGKPLHKLRQPEEEISCFENLPQRPAPLPPAPNRPVYPGYCEITSESYFLPQDCARISGNVPAVDVSSTDPDYGICKLLILTNVLPNVTTSLYPARKMNATMYAELKAAWERPDQDITIQYNLQNPTTNNDRQMFNPCHSANDTVFYRDCDWFSYLKTCYRPCRSKIMGRSIIVPLQMYRSQSSPERYAPVPKPNYTPDSTGTGLYKSTDCALQPFYLPNDINITFPDHNNPASAPEHKIYSCRYKVEFEGYDECGWRGVAEEFILEPGTIGTPTERIIRNPKPSILEDSPPMGIDDNGNPGQGRIKAWMRNEVEAERVGLKAIRDICQTSTYGGDVYVPVYTYGKFCFRGGRSVSNDWAGFNRGFCSYIFPNKELLKRRNGRNRVLYHSEINKNPPVIDAGDYRVMRVPWSYSASKLIQRVDGTTTATPVNWFATNVPVFRNSNFFQDPSPTDNILYMYGFLSPCLDSTKSYNIVAWNHLAFYADTGRRREWTILPIPDTVIIKDRTGAGCRTRFLSDPLIFNARASSSSASIVTYSLINTSPTIRRTYIGPFGHKLRINIMTNPSNCYNVQFPTGTGRRKTFIVNGRCEVP